MQLRYGAAGLGFLSILALAVSAQAQTPIKGDVKIGPYRIGMSAEEVQAANPGVAWTLEYFEKNANKVRVLLARQGLSLAGQLFDVIVSLDDGYGSYLLDFHLRTMIDMDACEDDFLAVVGEMEKPFGIFSPSSDFVIPPGKNVMAAGKKSTVRFDRDRRNALWDTVRFEPYPRDRYYVQLHAHFNGVANREIAGCFISVNIIREPPTES
jgi:hypothetical protein